MQSTESRDGGIIDLRRVETGGRAGQPDRPANKNDNGGTP